MSFLDDLQETAGSYVHPGIANGAKNIRQALDKITKNRKGFSLDKVMANVKNDFARPNLIEVAIDKVKGSSQEPFRINCFQAQIPGTNIATTDPKTVDMRSDDTPYAFDFGPSAIFTAGQILSISFDPTDQCGDTNATIVFRYNNPMVGV